MAPMTTTESSRISEAYINGNNQPLRLGVGVQTFKVTAFDNHSASDNVGRAFALQIRACTGLLGVILERLTWRLPCDRNQSTGCDEQGTEVVDAVEELLRDNPWMTAIGKPTHEMSDWMVGHSSFVSKLLMTRPPSLLLCLLSLLVLDYLAKCRSDVADKTMSADNNTSSL